MHIIYSVTWSSPRRSAGWLAQNGLFAAARRQDRSVGQQAVDGVLSLRRRLRRCSDIGHLPLWVRDEFIPLGAKALMKLSSHCSSVCASGGELVVQLAGQRCPLELGHFIAARAPPAGSTSPWWRGTTFGHLVCRSRCSPHAQVTAPDPGPRPA